jgi:hypothetical protein
MFSLGLVMIALATVVLGNFLGQAIDMEVYLKAV